MCVTDPCPPYILGLGCGSLLPLPCGLDCLVLHLRAHRELVGASFDQVHAWRAGQACQIALKRVRTIGSPSQGDLTLLWRWGQRACHLPIGNEVPLNGPATCPDVAPRCIDTKRARSGTVEAKPAKAQTSPKIQRWRSTLASWGQ